MPTELVMLDTNVLVYALYEGAPQHRAAFHLLDQAQTEGSLFCVSPQVLAEFYSVITNPRRVSSPFAPNEVLQEVDNIRALPGMTVLPVPLDLVDRWAELVRRYPVTGRKVFDLQLVATMLGNGVKKMYTFNVTDFEPFPEVEVLLPEVS